LYSVSCSAACG
ncbi:hypothetical protein ECEC1865_6060, partial [Escherichia coli EC1865]